MAGSWEVVRWTRVLGLSPSAVTCPCTSGRCSPSGDPGSLPGAHLIPQRLLVLLCQGGSSRGDQGSPGPPNRLALCTEWADRPRFTHRGHGGVGRKAAIQPKACRTVPTSKEPSPSDRARSVSPPATDSLWEGAARELRDASDPPPQILLQGECPLCKLGIPNR